MIAKSAMQCNINNLAMLRTPLFYVFRKIYKLNAKYHNVTSMNLFY